MKKIQKDIQQQGKTGTLQKDQHHKNSTHCTQRQGQQTSKEWGNLQIQMPTYKLPQGIHWRIWENIWGQAQRAS